MLAHLYMLVNKEYVAILNEHDKLILQINHKSGFIRNVMQKWAIYPQLRVKYARKRASQPPSTYLLSAIGSRSNGRCVLKPDLLPSDFCP